MKTALIAVSSLGAKLAQVLAQRLPSAEAYVFAPHAIAPQHSFEALHEIIRELWDSYEGLVFLCASGIAVRAIAPYVSSKHTDPAVVVCGDTGAFAISLLSGHEGGANGLAHEVAVGTQALPVITTASESSPRVLPRNLVLGIGCRRGASVQTIQQVFVRVFAEQHLSPLRVRMVCTIDLKQNEPGLLHFAKTLGASFVCFTANELNAAAGTFTASDFVKELTGTDCVCERAAVLGGTDEGSKGRLIVQKTASDGVTLAVFESDKEY
ncbi:cobalt-precorrin 5A hydrolase [Breznakiellaceae bacterium SP9]